jgi:hypothetical protein
VAASIARSRFHLAVRHERIVEPTLICPLRRPTARSASQLSSVSVGGHLDLPRWQPEEDTMAITERDRIR